MSKPRVKTKRTEVMKRSTGLEIITHREKGFRMRRMKTNWWVSDFPRIEVWMKKRKRQMLKVDRKMKFP